MALALALALDIIRFVIDYVVKPTFRFFRDHIWPGFSACFKAIKKTFEKDPPNPQKQPHPPYQDLEDHTKLLDQGPKDQTNPCTLIIARDLHIEHLQNRENWDLVNNPSEPRFPEVAELLKVWFFYIKTSVNFLGLSANTKYSAYLIFKRTEDSEGLHVIMNTSVSVVGRKPETKSVCLKPTRATPAIVGRPKERSDGWLELELGKFDCDIVTNKDAVIIIQETERMDIKKAGLIVAGIEIRAVN